MDVKPKLPLFICASCNNCEKWAKGIGCGGDPTRGRCTNAFSLLHEHVTDQGEGCSAWSPSDETLLVRH